MPCIDAFEPLAYGQIERELYIRLVRHANGGTLGREALANLEADLEESKGKKTEEVMLRLLDSVFRVLGFEVQRGNGPRETCKRKTAGSTLKFGPEGDDLAAVFARTPLAYSEARAGWVLAVEAKAGRAPKKSVGQAVTFAGRVRSAWGEEWCVHPVVVSGHETYSEKSAKDYARDNAVVHLPVSGLVATAKHQWEQFRAGKGLVTPPGLLSFVAYARDAGYTEPTAEELAKAVSEIAERRSAAWLPDKFGS